MAKYGKIQPYTHRNAAYGAIIAGLPAQIATKGVGKKSAKPFHHGTAIQQYWSRMHQEIHGYSWGTSIKDLHIR